MCYITHAVLALASTHLFLPQDPLLLYGSSLDFAVTECVVFAAVHTVQRLDQSPQLCSPLVQTVDLVLRKAVPERARASG